MEKNSLHKKIFIQTWGCQMNEYDTQLIKSILTKNNFNLVPNDARALDNAR